jgi:hypothetical protein
MREDDKLLSIRSLDVGLNLSGFSEDVEVFFRSNLPHRYIPDYACTPVHQKATLSFTNGPAGFTADPDAEQYHYTFDGPEPTKNIMWMAWPILERAHQTKRRYSLHASAFAVGERGVVITGETNSGKTSTLLHAMLERGHHGISGEHTVISTGTIEGGTRWVEFSSGLALNRPALKAILGAAPISWRKEDRVQLALDELGKTAKTARLSLVVFPIVTDEPELHEIEWPQRKRVIEIYKKMSESIRAFNSFLFNNTVGFPSLDSPDLSRDRMTAATAIGTHTQFLVLKGRTNSILDRVERALQSVHP